MMTYFILDEFDSRDIGTLTNKPVFNKPERMITDKVLPGRNGSLTEDYETYKNIELPIEMKSLKNIWEMDVVEKLEVFNKLAKFSWLDGVYKVKRLTEFSIEQVKQDFTIKMKLLCEPFRYLDEYELVFGKSGEIYVEGTRETEHITTIRGNGNISLYINDEQIIFKDVVDYVTLDIFTLSAYNSGNVKMIGEFLKFKPGKNVIYAEGNVTAIETKFRGRCLI